MSLQEIALCYIFMMLATPITIILLALRKGKEVKPQELSPIVGPFIAIEKHEETGMLDEVDCEDEEEEEDYNCCYECSGPSYLGINCGCKDETANEDEGGKE